MVDIHFLIAADTLVDTGDPMRKLNLINTANPPPSASMGSSSSSPSMPEVRLSDQALSLCSPPLTVTSSSHLQSLYGHCPPGKNFSNNQLQSIRYLFKELLYFYSLSRPWYSRWMLVGATSWYVHRCFSK